MGITRYWDRGGWAYGESIFDGRTLPLARDDERFWMQRESPFCGGGSGIGDFPTQEEVRRSNVPPNHASPWAPKRRPGKSKELTPPRSCIHCSRLLTHAEQAERRMKCSACRAAAVTSTCINCGKALSKRDLQHRCRRCHDCRTAKRGIGTRVTAA